MSTAEKAGNYKRSQYKVGWVIRRPGATRQLARPEKIDCTARCQPRWGTAKAVVTQGLW